MKRRAWIAVISGLLLNSFALAQTTSHFDLSGNATFSGAKLANAPSASTQIDSFGWQTSGVTHLNRWLGITSQFGSGYASSNSLQLIGYTGPGTITHYSMLVGPRITIPMRGRFSPFVEGLAGGDRASTKLVSNGVSVTGREMQIAYSVGGGAQLNLNRRFGVNVEAQYLNTEHTLAFTGWEPANLQISAGIVIHMFGGRPQIAEQRPMPSPSTTGSTEPTVIASTPSTSVETAPAPTPVASFQPPSMPAVEAAVESKPSAIVITTPEPQPAASVIAPAPVIAVSPAPAVSAKAVVPPPVVVTQPAPKPVVAVAPAPAPVVAASPAPVRSAKAVVPPPVVVTQPAPKPVVAVAPAPVTAAAPAQATPAPSPRVVAQTQPQQQQPLSLGEYARRLREQKQRERQQQQQ